MCSIGKERFQRNGVRLPRTLAMVGNMTAPFRSREYTSNFLTTICGIASRFEKNGNYRSSMQWLVHHAALTTYSPMSHMDWSVLSGRVAYGSGSNNTSEDSLENVKISETADHIAPPFNVYCWTVGRSQIVDICLRLVL